MTVSAEEILTIRLIEKQLTDDGVVDELIALAASKIEGQMAYARQEDVVIMDIFFHCIARRLAQGMVRDNQLTSPKPFILLREEIGMGKGVVYHLRKELLKVLPKL